MCVEYSKSCQCGKHQASFHFQDNIMPPEVIGRLYCPECSKQGLDPDSSVQDNGWAIEYIMEVAGFSAHNLPSQIRDHLSPSTLFDEGYASWRGLYPGDHIDSVSEREEIVKLAKTDPREYMKKIKQWAVTRMDRLQREGWRKANAA